MNVVFLDVDGVLNSNAFAPIAAETEKQLDPGALLLLQKICQENNAGVVITSGWRMGSKKPSDEYNTLLLPALNDLGISVLGRTPVFFSNDRFEERGKEIWAWINENLDGKDRFIIIDDEIDDITPYFSTHCILETNWLVGIQPCQVSHAKNMFEQQGSCF